MCTLVLLRRPDHPWPLLLAANRDERLDRAWDPPAAHWPGRPGVVAGRDRAGGGTWMGVNRAGVVAAVLNRPGSLGPAPGKRSRGELPLLALAHASAAEAAGALAALDAGAYRPFNLVVADARDAVFLRAPGAGRPQGAELAPGTHMITAHDPDDPASRRIARHLPRFRAAPPPEPDAEAGWEAWRAILADRSGPAGTEINVPSQGGFGTGCASLLGLAAGGGMSWLFAAGPPDLAPFRPVSLA